MNSVGMGRHVCFLLLVWGSLGASLPRSGQQGVPLGIVGPQARQDETFSHGFTDGFAQNLPTNEFMGSFKDTAAAREDHVGFIVGMPDNFPSFASIGGFEPMGDIAKDDSAGSFVPAFSIPVVDIPDIPDNQPQFAPPNFPQQSLDSDHHHRVRRTAGEPADLDPSLVPHRRVHRVGAEAERPHNRSPREFRVIHDSRPAPSETPFLFDSFPTFAIPEFHSEKLVPGRTSSASFGERSFSSSRPFSLRGDGRDMTRRADAPVEDTLTDDQRFVPTLHPHARPSHHQPFFPSPPLSPRTPGPRGRGFNSHGPGFREPHQPREPHSGFRDFHETFYGPGGREAIHNPEFAFSSNRRPHQREQEYGPLDNSLLGSGNFEVLRGGTYFDPDDPNSHGHGYDHFLDEGYSAFPNSHNAPPTNNYVDDFFSNFRDFSEFAVRRSDDGETTALEDDGGFYPTGFASEHLPLVFKSPDANDTDSDGSENESVNMEEQRTEEEELEAEGSSPTTTKDTKEDHYKHRQPKNIQDVLEDLEAEPSEYSVSALTIDEKDPLIAMF